MDSDIAKLKGHTTHEAEALLEQEGPNELPEPPKHRLKKWLKRFFAPIPLMLIAAAVFSFVLGKVFDGWFILALFLVNLAITVWHEWKAENTLKILKENVTATVKTLRDGVWQKLDSKKLVRNDVIELTSGSVIPTDAKVLEANAGSVNESVLTGESLPVDKQVGDKLFAGSYVAGGILRAKVTAIGVKTKFGHMAIEDTERRKRSILEQDILRISKFLSLTSIGLAIAITAAWLLFSEQNIFEIIRFDLTMLIAGIPVALPVVMSLIISFGTLDLSRRSAIVRRLSSLEDFANVDQLLSDKTGTLTKNDIQVHSAVLMGDVPKEEAAALAAATTTEPDYQTLERAIVDFAKSLGTDSSRYQVVDVVPPDSVRKRSSVLVKENDSFIRVSLGAPQVIKGLADADEETAAHYDKTVEDAGTRGLRVLGLAVRRGAGDEQPPEEHMTLVALFLLSDELREDAREVVDFLAENSVNVKMLTGDNIVVSREIAKQLALRGDVVSCQDIAVDELSEEKFESIGVFSEVYPEDKKKLVALAEKHHTVAVTGDGINDLPALRSANVGIAVSNAVDALKSTADIVLTKDGIGVIKNAVIESRKIFSRIYSYSIYRISESFRLIIAVALFGIFLSLPILTPIQLIILALLNDLPIVTLAANRVSMSHKPSSINVRRRFVLSLLYGTIGLLNSVLFFVLAKYFFHLPWDQIQTLFFLKLTISGHMLIYVAHTAKRWFRFLPSTPVILATTGTQIVATLFAVFGLFMSSAPLGLILFVWVWAFFWMQITELMKVVRQHFEKKHGETVLQGIK
jgi:H+-transporting ATPase